MMSDLPKREDPIYKEIESFADYELTQCVAYEMAIRNKDNLKAIDEVIDFYKNNKHLIDFYDDYYNRRQYSELALMVSLLEVVPFISSDAMSMFNVLGFNVSYENNFIDNLSYYEDKRINKVIYSIIEDEFTVGLCHLKRGMLSEEIRVICDDLTEYTTLSKMQFREGYTIETGISETTEHAILVNEDTDTSEYVSDVESFKKYVEQGDFENLCTNNDIKMNFKRPKVKTSLANNLPKIEIDLNYPLNELVAYISHVKRDLENNKDILKSPIELLGDDLERAGKPPKKKSERWANMFFVYDYVKAKQNEIKIYNDKVKEKLDEKISDVKENKYTDRNDKKIQIAVLEKEYTQDKDNTDIKSIFNDDELTEPLGLSGANISKLYYAIKPYIDDLKYKELVTGVSAI